jgi:hypothetical protein
MKTIVKIITMIFVLGTGLWINPQKVQGNPAVTFQVFYDGLAPYGTWINNPEYGYIWVPNADPGFFPYGTSGYWVFTAFGWTWVSDYPWGWAPFHYGRWYYDDWYGWAWIPGNDWGPAWVTWRRCDGYFGWAPLTPGIIISMGTGWNSYNIPANRWCFVPDHYFGRRDLARYYVNRRDNDRLYNRSTFIVNSNVDRRTNARYYSGPDMRMVHRATGQEFKPVEVRNDIRPGQHFSEGRLSIYRPEINQTAGNEARKPAPAKFVPYPLKSKTAESSSRNERGTVINKENRGIVPNQSTGRIVNGNSQTPDQKSTRHVVPVNNGSQVHQVTTGKNQRTEGQVRPPEQHGRSSPQTSHPVINKSNDQPHKVVKSQPQNRMQGHPNATENHPGKK